MRSHSVTVLQTGTTDQGHPRSLISVAIEMAYGISYQ